MLLFYLFLVFLCGSAEGLKILFYQVAFSKSHMPFSGALADTLIGAGHTVDQVVMLFNPKVTSNGSTRLRNVYKVVRKDEENPFLRLGHFSDPFDYAPDPRHNPDYIEARKVFCEDLLNNEELIETLKAEHYDSYMTAPYDYCGVGLGWVLGIPSINAYTATQYDEYIPKYWATGSMPSFVSFIFEQEVFPKEFGFFQRLRAFRTAFDHWFFDHGIGVEEYAFMARKYPNFPSPVDLFNRITYVFRNTNELISRPRPESPKTKYVGGIVTANTKTELTPEVERILDQPSNGTIVFSFGSLLPTTAVRRSIKTEILRTFSAFPTYQFVWKFDAHDADFDLFTNQTNVHPIEWLPQVELLKHQKVRVFISHMGLNSYIEASMAGKPLIGIPVFADQQYNTGCAMRNGVAVFVDKTEITAARMIDALHQVLDDPSYAENAARIAAMLRDRKENPKAVLVDSIEYAAEHPELAEVLRFQAAGMPLWQFFCLDVLLVLLLSTAFLLTTISFSNTHMPYSGAIADALIERGHTVDKLILVYNSKVQTNGSTRLRNVFRIELPGGSPFAKAAHLTTPFETPPLNRREAMSIKNRRLFCERLLEDDALISRLKAEEYDVYLTIPFEYCALGLNQLLKIPSVHHYTVIQQLSQINGYSDTPRPPSFAPDVFQCEQQGKEKSFWSRLKSFLYSADVNLFPETLAAEELAGLNSYLEASYAGKPLISIPFFVDQFYNVDAMLYNEVAVYLQKEELSFETMRDALRTVLEDPKYEQNAKEIARMLRERPEDPKDVLVRSVEYAARHPKLAAVLQMQSAMPLWKYFSLDVIAFLFSAFCFSLTLVVFVLRTLLRLIVKSKVKKE
ncbi:Glucuronosyltransferase [Aphelenchoides fujianensis]|nr:Glucuronosyltransferase [Aphelenchoides fujianensis]